jgi:phosphoribosylformylglycinamidine cyclo-ligase
LKYLPDNVKVIKDGLPATPLIFELIQRSSGADIREMFQVFNMGTRLEIYTDEKNATEIIAMANLQGVRAKLIGKVAASDKKGLQILYKGESLEW